MIEYSYELIHDIFVRSIISPKQKEKVLHKYLTKEELKRLEKIKKRKNNID